MQKLAINRRWLVLISAFLISLPIVVSSGEIARTSRGSVEISAKRQGDVGVPKHQLEGEQVLRPHRGHATKRHCMDAGNNLNKRAKKTGDRRFTAERLMLFFGFVLANSKGKGVVYHQ